MAHQTYGPVEFYLLSGQDTTPSPEVLASLLGLVNAGTIRILDYVTITKSADGTVSHNEVIPEDGVAAVEGLTLEIPGIAGEEDIEEHAKLLDAGSSAALVALELTWAAQLAKKVQESGAQVLSVERIPAPVVNALVDSVSA